MLRGAALMKDKESFLVVYFLFPLGSECFGNLGLEFEVALVRPVRLVTHDKRRPLLERHRRRSRIGQQITPGDLSRGKTEDIETRLLGNHSPLLKVFDRRAAKSDSCVSVWSRLEVAERWCFF